MSCKKNGSFQEGKPNNSRAFGFFFFPIKQTPSDRVFQLRDCDSVSFGSAPFKPQKGVGKKIHMNMGRCITFSNNNNNNIIILMIIHSFFCSV